MNDVAVNKISSWGTLKLDRVEIWTSDSQVSGQTPASYVTVAIKPFRSKGTSWNYKLYCSTPCSYHFKHLSVILLSDLNSSETFFGCREFEMYNMSNIYCYIDGKDVEKDICVKIFGHILLDLMDVHIKLNSIWSYLVNCRCMRFLCRVRLGLPLRVQWNQSLTVGINVLYGQHC